MNKIKFNITSLSPCIFLNLFKLSTLNNNQEIKNESKNQRILQLQVILVSLNV